jgi:uncharacterized protein (TIGR03435 family)
VAVLAGAVVAPIIRGQGGAADLRFEAVSIKPSPPFSGQPPVLPRGADLFARNATTLQQLATYAYDLPEYRIVGAPSWMIADRYDIVARASAPLNGARTRVLLQAMLAERFALRVHRETREMTIHDLVFARTDHRFGPNLKPAVVDCTPFRTLQRPLSESPLMTAGDREIPRCATSMSWSTTTGVMTPNFNGEPIERLVTWLESELRAPVRDKTGLTGVFDIGISAVSERLLDQPGAQRPTGEGPSIRTALQEQLGLKLESTEAPVELLVIDAAQRPTAN